MVIRNGCDNFIMYNHQHPGVFPTNSQFTPWNQQASQLLRMRQALPYHPYPQQFLPNMPLQQQPAPYYNPHFSMPPPFYPPIEHPRANHPPHYMPPWQPHPSQAHPPAKTPTKPQLKLKRPAEVICLDDESHHEAIVILDSEQIIQVKEMVPTQPAIQPPEDQALSEKSPNKNQKAKLQEEVNKWMKQKGLNAPKKYSKKQIRPVPTPPVSKEEPKQPAKLKKKKKIVHERYGYKLKTHEKELMQLSDCREFFPGEILVGPQFQFIFKQAAQKF